MQLRGKASLDSSLCIIDGKIESAVHIKSPHLMWNLSETYTLHNFSQSDFAQFLLIGKSLTLAK